MRYAAWMIAIVAIAWAGTFLDVPAAHPYALNEPAHFPRMVIPADNPLTQEGVALGQRLFFDPILSKGNKLSCASCHLPKGAFTDNKALSVGVRGKPGRRSSMSLMNVGYIHTGLFWDGRAATLEEQALAPVEDSLELHEDWDNVVAKLQQHDTYPDLFRQAFGIKKPKAITKELVAKALAQFERTLISADSKYDRVVAGKETFTESEQRGYQIFMDEANGLPEAECGHCHAPPLFTTNEYQNNGLENVTNLDDFPDKGRGEVTGNRGENGKFRIPTLRNIALTAPYMHDGRFKTLKEVIEHYNSGGHHSETKNPNVRPLYLSKQDKADLIAFLRTLTDSVESRRKMLE